MPSIVAIAIVIPIVGFIAALFTRTGGWWALVALTPGLVFFVIGLVLDARQDHCTEECWRIAGLIGAALGVIWFLGAAVGGVVGALTRRHARRHASASTSPDS
ncbi:MAG: hypothetical protein QOH73_1787 [Gaiellaceae bacterium]|jgi:hypothetical protein|nr:hypothetical protein [Gaiellaceae bacterium]